ncbi:probable aminotransferase TAT2 isoform X1 [Fagus crenata]
MGEFGSIVPVVTLGSIAKRWLVPGWRIGWLVTNDPSGILEKSGVVESLKSYLYLCPDPATFTQGAIAQILENTKDDFFSKILNIIREAADICYDRIKEIPCLTCPYKPEGSMSVMVSLNLSLLEDISDDLDFCLKLAKEESVTVLPGFSVGMKNWLRITFAVELASLEEALDRMKAFCLRHGRRQ